MPYNTLEKRREYFKKYRERNKEKLTTYFKEYYQKQKAETPEKIKEAAKKYRTENKRICNERVNNWRINNPDKHAAKEAKRRTKKLQAFVSWANKFYIDEIYHLAALRSNLTNTKWHVDHIVPLQHPLVCGLHCEFNLQVIHAEDNLKKHNSFYI